MGDISIIEFIVAAIIAYSSMLMLIILTIKDIPATRSHSIVRVVYLIPGFVCAIYLAGAGVNINLITTSSGPVVNGTITDSQLINETTYNSTGDLTFTVLTNNTAPVTSYIVLQNPVWVTINFLIAAVIMVHIVTQLLSLFTKTD